MLAEIALLAASCAPDIHPVTLTAIVRHESSGNPFAIGVNRGERLSRQPQTRAAAIRTVQDLIDKGIDFDAGLGQINVRNWSWLGLTPETVFDPCTNLRASQTVLKDCYERATQRFDPGQPALQAALSCYNTGNFERGFRNGYVSKVLTSAGVSPTTPAVPALRGEAPGQKAHNAGATETQATAPDTPTRPDDGQTHAFSRSRPDAFAQPCADAFAQAGAVMGTVGSIRYHRRSLR